VLAVRRVVAEVRTGKTQQKKGPTHLERGKRGKATRRAVWHRRQGGIQEDMTGQDPETIHAQEGKMGLVCMEKKMNLERGGISRTGQDK